MPRPRKCRRVCGLPAVREFAPSQPGRAAPVELLVEEFEALRLIDHQGLSQQQCSRMMGVSRATVQQIYDRARRLLAKALVEGAPLVIGGGDYRVCQGEGGCGRICPRQVRHSLGKK